MVELMAMAVQSFRSNLIISSSAGFHSLCLLLHVVVTHSVPSASQILPILQGSAQNLLLL